MTGKKFDIIQMIEKNPITRLSSEYQNKLINKIKTNFNDKEQQLFVSSFYCYLNYDSKNDFVINFNDIWKLLGYTRKDNAKRLLEKIFTEDIDYKILLRRSEEQKNDTRGGHNKEDIMLTINAFKKFCLKSDTKKADEIHEYYIKLEDILNETINE
jgi:phage anti-repressor protein